MIGIKVLVTKDIEVYTIVGGNATRDIKKDIK